MSHAFVVALILLLPCVALGQGKLTPRPLDPLAAETLSRAIKGSAVVRALVERLESSNVIVHILTAAEMPSGIRGMTRFVTSRAGYRYLRIVLRSDLALTVRSSVPGHELRHACEVADSSVTDVASRREFFEREGHATGPFFDTKEAQRIERSVLLELLGAAGQRKFR